MWRRRLSSQPSVSGSCDRLSHHCDAAHPCTGTFASGCTSLQPRLPAEASLMDPLLTRRHDMCERVLRFERRPHQSQQYASASGQAKRPSQSSSLRRHLESDCSMEPWLQWPRSSFVRTVPEPELLPKPCQSSCPSQSKITSPSLASAVCLQACPCMRMAWLHIPVLCTCSLPDAIHNSVHTAASMVDWFQGRL